MSKISEQTKERITQEVLKILFEQNLTPLSTKDIAEMLIRDDELILKILKNLHQHKIIKLEQGYARKRYWSMTSEAYTEYKKLI